jgi:Flp pilus assembly protein TadG
MSRRAIGRLSRQRGERGQATVELALLLPVICGLLLLIVQVGLVARAQILLTAATREAARAAAVDPDRQAALSAGTDGSGLNDALLDLAITDVRDGLVNVRGTYRAPVAVPFLGIIRREVHLEASLVVRTEQSIPSTGARHTE